jgi:uncharacterized protein YbaP (TraB family)
MNKSFLLALLTATGIAFLPNKKVDAQKPAEKNTLLWKISGKNLTKPSYIFGTMHMICANDIEVSDSLSYAIQQADKVYLELDMDDMMQMLGAMAHMTMRGDTSLADLLSAEDYKKVKDYFQETNSMIPFSMLEKYKPLLMEAMIMEKSPACEEMVVMEQLIMDEAKKYDKEIKGLETMDYQLSIFDKIPYKQQALQLVKLVDDAKSGKNNDDKEMKILTDAYRKQELSKMDELTKDDPGISEFSDILLYDRNANWAAKLPSLMESNPLLIAVGAGHLPGKKGVLNLLRQAGYKVEPVTNNMIKKKTKTI